MSSNSMKQNITQTISWIASNKAIDTINPGPNGITYSINKKHKKRRR
jgi:hypothetical protein